MAWIWKKLPQFSVLVSPCSALWCIGELERVKRKLLVLLALVRICFKIIPKQFENEFCYSQSNWFWFFLKYLQRWLCSEAQVSLLFWIVQEKTKKLVNWLRVFGIWLQACILYFVFQVGWVPWVSNWLRPLAMMWWLFHQAPIKRPWLK